MAIRNQMLAFLYTRKNRVVSKWKKLYIKWLQSPHHTNKQTAEYTRTHNKVRLHHVYPLSVYSIMVIFVYIKKVRTVS